MWIDRMDLKSSEAMVGEMPTSCRNRSMAMLQSIMSYPNFVMKNSIMSQLVRLEEHSVQFEKMGGKLTDEMKPAVALKCMSGPLRTHLNHNFNESSTYAQVREVIKAYDTATTWTDSVSSSPGKEKLKAKMEKGRRKAKSRRARAKPMVSKTNETLRHQLRGTQLRKVEKLEIRTTRAKARASQKMV